LTKGLQNFLVGADLNIAKIKMNTILDFDFIKSIGIKDSQLKPQKNVLILVLMNLKLKKLLDEQ